MSDNDALAVELEPDSWERKCQGCGAVHVEGEEMEEICPNCGTALGERVVSVYRWKCPECGAECYAPAKHEGKVSCKDCRAEFEVSGIREVKPRKKKKAAKVHDPLEEIPFLPEETAVVQGAIKSEPVSIETLPALPKKGKKKKKEEPVQQMALGI